MRRNFHLLLANSRFWILAIGFVLSINSAGFVQLLVPSGSVQTIRIEQLYGFASLIFLYLAMIMSPLFKVFPRIPYKATWIHARRAIGVLAWYYALLHVYITFFYQLDGFQGVTHLNRAYELSVLSGAFACLVLTVMAVTSFDGAVRLLRFRNWKVLHRTVYIAGFAILLHVLILGPNYARIDVISATTGIALIVLLVLESMRIYQTATHIRQKHT